MTNKHIEKLNEIMRAPMPQSMNDSGWDLDGNLLFFDPWLAFDHAFYGSYDNEFDELAVNVLSEIYSGAMPEGGLAARMFRETLCIMGLCSYGTSPRRCFPTAPFKELLPDLIRKWHQYAIAQWGAANCMSRPWSEIEERLTTTR